MTEQQTASAAPGAQNSTPRRWYQGFFSHKAPLKDRTEEVCKSESGADDSEFPDGRSADTDLNRGAPSSVQQVVGSGPHTHSAALSVPPPAVPTAASRPIPALPAPLHRQSSSRSGRLSLQFLGRSFSSGTLRREEAAAGTEEEEEELDDRSSTSSERRERRRRQHQADRDDYQSFRRRSIPAAISSSLEEFSRNLTKSRQPSGGTGEGNWTDAREGSGAGEGEPTQQLLDVPALKGTESTEGGSSSLSPSRSPEGREKSPSASLGQAVTQSVQALHERYMHRRSASETFRRMRTGKTDDDAAVSQGSATQMSAPLGRSQDIMQPQQAQSAEQPSIATQQVISERPLETDAQLSRETEVLRANYEGPTHPDPLPASKMPATVTELASRDALPIAAGGALPVSEGGNFPVAVGAVQPEACAARQGPVAPSDLSNDADGQVAGTTVTSQIDAAEPRKRIEGWDEVVIPEVLQAGVPMLKVTHKKVMQRVFRLDSDRGQILWDSKKNNKGELLSSPHQGHAPSDSSGPPFTFSTVPQLALQSTSSRSAKFASEAQLLHTEPRCQSQLPMSLVGSRSFIKPAVLTRPCI